MKEGYEKYCRNGLCEGESKPKKYYLDEHDHEELKDKCWYSGCQCPGERLIISKEKQQQKQNIIDMMKGDEELGLYNRTFEDYLQKLKDRRTEDDYKYTDEDFKNRIHYIFDCYEKDLSVYKCLEFMYFVEREIKAEDVFNDQKKEGLKEFIDKHKQETLEEVALEFAKDHHEMYETSNLGSMHFGFCWGAKWQQEQHDLLPGLTKQFDPKEGEMNGEQWTAVHFLKWLELNKFKIVK